MRRRGERIERSFAHVCDMGGMRRTHLRGHTDILKRLLILAGTSRLNRMHGVRLDADTRDVDWGACGNQPRDGITTVSG
jgi:hypothetical protein